MIAETITDRFYQGRPLAAAGPLDGTAGGIVDRHHIVAIHLQAAHSGTNPLLGQRWGARLQLTWHRDGPLVVVDDDDHRQMPYPGAVEPLQKIPLGGAAVADGDYGNPRLITQFESRGNTAGVGDLGGDGDADREIFRGSPIGFEKITTPLVPTPILQVFLHRHAPHIEGGHVPIVGNVDILRLHGETNANPHGFCAEMGGKSTEFAGSLQRYRFFVIAAHHHHIAVESVQYRLVQPGR